MQIKEEIMFKYEFANLNLACYGCLKDDHVVTNCPLLHFSVNKYIFIKIRNKYKNNFIYITTRAYRKIMK